MIGAGVWVTVGVRVMVGVKVGQVKPLISSSSLLFTDPGCSSMMSLLAAAVTELPTQRH